jgi:hypothetical protein
MTKRSLVGMSMGARKRICREDQNLEVAGYDLSLAAITLLHEIRAAYRIGQKLRPCPGNGCRRGQSWCLRCDGTGVVSAKKEKAHDVG